MATNVPPFRNSENFKKYLLFYFEPGCNVIIRTILWLTGGEEELKKKLNKAEKDLFNKDETKKIRNYLNGGSKFNIFDITFYFKICKYMCDLKPTSDEVWSVKLCPDGRKDDLEYLLLMLKNGRNELAHPSEDHRNLLDEKVEEKCEVMKDLLTKILEKAGEEANVSAGDIQIEVKEMESHLERIKNDTNIDKSLQPHIRNLIQNDLKEIYEKELESSFQNELRGYSIPYLKKQDESEICRLSGNHFSSAATVILGEAGAGKTALTKFLFYSWLTGNTESLEELAEFDIVLRIECSCINSRDLNMFFEEHFLESAFYFCNTSSLSRHFKDLKVLWIMDGFDESTMEFGGFLKSITGFIPQFHKVLITTREHAFQNLQEFLTKVVSFNLDKLLNDNIKEILENRIYDEEKRESIMTKYNSLTDTEKKLLETPINFVMYIELLVNGSIMKEGEITITKLYKESTKQQLTLLWEKHRSHTSLFSDDDLHLSIENWFYGSLCKRSFQNLVAGKYFLDCDEIKNLRIEATKGYLLPSACLSSFLESDKYKYKHSSQCLHFAASYMIKNPEDSSFDLGEEFYIDLNKLDLIEYFLQMAREEDPVNKSSEQQFEIICKFISSFKEFDQSFLWHYIWFSSYATEDIKEAISKVLKNCFYVNGRMLHTPSIIEFIKQACPEKIVIDSTIRVNSHSAYLIQNTDPISSFLENLHQFEYGKLQIELRPSLPENQEQEIKYQIMNRFSNAKHQLFYYEVVSNVIIRVLRELYVGQEPMEKHLMDLAASDNCCLTSRDIYLLKELTEGKITIEELNPALLLKLAEIIHEAYVRSKPWWRKLWVWFTQGEVKFTELLSDFNRLPHQVSKENLYQNIFPGCDISNIRELLNEVVAHNISYTGVTNNEEEINKARMSLTTRLSKIVTHETSVVESEQLEKFVKRCIEESNSIIKNDFDFSLINSILTRAGMEDSIDDVQLKLRDLSAKTNLDIMDTIHAKNIMVKELIEQYEVDKAYYGQEMKRYIPATLFDKDKEISVSHLSFEDYVTVYVNGDSGIGKSALARYLFASWASGDMDSLVWLKSFDIVFLVNGKIIQHKFVSELLEFLLPISCNIFPTTNLLMKQLENMKVLWILDDFDALSQLFNHLYKRFFKFHKFLRTMPYNDFMPFSVSKVKVYKIALLCVENIDIFLSKSIPKSRYNTIRKSLMSRLHEGNKLCNPFYLSSYIELLQSETMTTLQLYSECKLNETILHVNYTNLQLQRLKDKYSNSASRVDKWFYGSLCRQSFSILFSIINNIEFNLQCEHLEVINEDAVKKNLDPETCLNFFLVKELCGAEGASYSFNNGFQPYILASFFLRKWKDYPPFLENETIKKGLLETTAIMLNSFIIMTIYEGLDETFAEETVSKVASAYGLNDVCLIWHNICAMSNFQERVMKFIANILDGLECYVIPHEILTISELVAFFTFITPKTIRFTSIYISKSKCNKEAYRDLLNVLKKKRLDILIGPIDPWGETKFQHPGGEFFGVNVLDLINDAASLNVTFFQGDVSDLLLLGNHFGKFKKLCLGIYSVVVYHELCTILSKMDHLEEINLKFYNFLKLNETYPVEFVTRTTITILHPIFDGFTEMFQTIKGETTSKFKKLIIKNSRREDEPNPDYDIIFNSHFSRIEFP